ncbi:MAG TPA: UTP--glucose-1-phosphate uridylyltransferase GalU [Candidatus Sulfotelmatobacter sp.]|nr:UTP--glucose-1-phosphate uridylyltransferase GalU [Candidatus Sulfotelmatobacter sp.]
MTATKRVRKAIFPVGGLGTRFLPATKAMPKEMLPVVDKPLIQYAVEEARAAGIDQFIFVTGRGKAAIEDHFDRSSELESTLLARGKHDLWHSIEVISLNAGCISYTRQPEPLGLGHAVWCARSMVGDEPFAVLLADDLILSGQPCLKQMIDVHASVGGNMVAVMDVPEEHTSRYGIVDPFPGPASHGGRLVGIKGMIEKPRPAAAPSTLAIIGRYILQPETFAQLDGQDRGAGGEIQLTDALSAMIGPMPFHGLRFEGRRFDCGDKVGFLEANIAFALDREDLGGDVRALLHAYRDWAAPWRRAG